MKLRPRLDKEPASAHSGKSMRLNRHHLGHCFVKRLALGEDRLKAAIVFILHQNC